MSFPSGVGGETLVYDLVVKPGKQLLGFIALTLRCSSGDFIMVALNGGAPVSYGPGLVQTPFTTLPSSFAITPSNYLDPVALSFNVEAQLVNAVTQRWTQNLRTAELVN